MGGQLSMILPLVILFLAMYFLLIRPQKKREKEVNAMRSGVQVGDEIITIGGICGKIVKTKDESLVIQVGADKVKFEIMRWAVSKVVEEGKRPSAKSKPESHDEEAEEPKKAKPKRMKKAAVEEPAEVAEEAVEVAEAEVAEAPADAEVAADVAAEETADDSEQETNK